jgi:replicative DNA helicase
MAKVALPSNVEAERCVLGSMLMDSAAASTAISSLTEDVFSDVDKRNLLVFKAMEAISSHNGNIDVQSVADTLNNLKMYDDAGGSEYLMELLQSTISPDNIDHYIKIIKDQAVLRAYLVQLQAIQDSYAQGNVPDIGDFLAKSTADLQEIASKRSVGEFKGAKEIAQAVESQIQKEASSDNRGLTGIDTGYRRLNKYTHGWQKSDLIIIAARPSVGKTAFALNLAVNAARYQDKPVAIFSCEMPSDQVMKRLIANFSLVKLEKIQAGPLDEKELSKVSSAVNTLSNSKLYIDDTPNPKLGDVVSKAMKLQAKLQSEHSDLSMIVIDYLNLITTEGNFESRANEVSVITKTLKQLARQMKVPVIALAQLNRDTEQNEGRVPMLSNLKESGSIEQDADIVLLMYRSDYYKSLGIGDNKATANAHGFGKDKYTQQLEQDVQQQTQAAGKDNGISVVSISVAKNRNGRTGVITLLFDKNLQRFDTPSFTLEQEEAKKNGVVLDADDDDGQ